MINISMVTRMRHSASLSRWGRFAVILGLAALFTGCPSPTPSGPEAQTYVGTLDANDAQLVDGEYADEYFVQAEVGDLIEVTLRSDDFDPYIMLEYPDGKQEENADFNRSTSVARITAEVTTSGRFRIIVTSDEPRTAGNYNLLVTRTPAQFKSDNPMSLVSERPDHARIETGTLEPGDQKLATGEYNDVYTFQGQAGQYVVIDLTSDSFDTYLILERPTGDQLDNDDHEGSASRSQIATRLEETGTYQIRVTSYQENETGAYDLTIVIDDSNVSDSAARTVTGRLESGDQTLTTGEYADVHSVEGTPGQRLTIDLSATGFDPYLVLTGPNGFRLENDDYEGILTQSRIETQLEERGTYQILVTSYEVGETGDYSLSIGTGSAPVLGASAQDSSPIQFGESRNGDLSDSDRTRLSGEFRDHFTLDAQEGDWLIIDMKSDAFDPFLILTLPDGRQIENDDHEGQTNWSRISYQLPESGRVRIVASSYAEGETGRYTLSVSRGLNFLRPPTFAGSGSNVYGIFVGMGEYGGRMGNLTYTAEDADRVKNALSDGVGMPDDHAIVLKNAQATKASFQRAVSQIAGRIGPNDTFVLFFSGHGGRYDRAVAAPNDPDAVDESIELYDAEILDDELAQMLDRIPAQTQLVVLDACFSGGFAKDLIAKPGRMGMFSSEEDVTSSVAGKFQAGGYLSQFFSEAIGAGRSDTDMNGEISAMELSQYVYERYRGEVKSGPGGAGNFVTTRDLGYQKLVVDRGSIAPDSPLFKHTGPLTRR